MEKPSPILQSDPIGDFDSGSPVLDRWLSTQALRNEGSGASRTYVVREEGRIVAFYSLATGGVGYSGSLGSLRRNRPDPVLIMILARLVVARAHQVRGVGRPLVQDALLRTLRVAEVAGIRAVTVHALDQQAAAFYEHLGFAPSPVDDLVLFARPAAVLAAIHET